LIGGDSHQALNLLMDQYQTEFVRQVIVMKLKLTMRDLSSIVIKLIILQD